MKKSWKKFLPLVICLALCMGLFTVSASAAGSTKAAEVKPNGDGTYSAYDADGNVIKNGWAATINREGDNGKVTKTWYYAKQGELLTGWQNIDGEWYYFNDNGFVPYMKTNTMVEIAPEEPYKTSGEAIAARDSWWVNADGTLRDGASGWVSKVYDKVVWNEKTGQAEPRRIFWYVNSDGTVYKGWLNDGGNWYEMLPEMATSELWTKIAGQEGWIVSYPYEWIDERAGTVEWDEVPHYFLNPDGTVPTGGWHSMMVTYTDEETGVDSRVREFFFANPAADGALVTGWNKIDGKWYYFGDPSHPEYNYNDLLYAADDNSGFFVYDDTLYRVDKSGAMITGWNRVANGEPDWYDWYYADPNGAMVEDAWRQIDGKWYYFNDDYTLANDGEFEWNGDWYYAGKDGAIATGWVQNSADEPWHYYGADGVEQYGWIQDGGNWYYLDSVGELVTNDWVDGFYVGSDGAYIAETPEG
jgi:glucan-binding YG repeat protein